MAIFSISRRCDTYTRSRPTCGKQSGATDDEVWSGAGSTSAEVYGALVGELFNRYYEDGVADAKEALL
jgi:hypothetical protein